MYFSMTSWRPAALLLVTLELVLIIFSNFCRFWVVKCWFLIYFVVVKNPTNINLYSIYFLDNWEDLLENLYMGKFTDKQDAWGNMVACHEPRDYYDRFHLASDRPYQQFVIHDWFTRVSLKIQAYRTHCPPLLLSSYLVWCSSNPSGSMLEPLVQTILPTLPVCLAWRCWSRSQS